MEISQLLELVNNTDVLETISSKLAEAASVNEWLTRGSNPFIPIQPSCELPIIKIFN